MIKIQKGAVVDLEDVDSPEKGCWINIFDSSGEETQKLAQDLGVDPKFLRFPLGRETLPRVEKADSGLRIIVRIPFSQSKRAAVPYLTLPLGIIVTNQWVITICQQDLDLLKDLDDIHREGLDTNKPYRFVMTILWSITNHYLRLLGEIDQAVDRIERRLQHSLENREVLSLLRYQKSLVYFTTALETNAMMLERLERADLMELKPPDADILDDVITENQEAMKVTEISRDILSQMMDAFASIISNNLNVVMKFLASITVVLIVPQVIATFLGMNFILPLERNPSAFVMIVALSLVLSVIIGLVFRKKKWL